MATHLSHVESAGVNRDFSDHMLVRRISPYYQAQLRRVGVVVTASAAALAISNAAVPVIVGRALDSIRTRGRGAMLEGMALVLAWTIAWAIGYLQRVVITRLTADTTLQLRQAATKAAFRHDLGFYDRVSVADVVSRVDTDTAAVATLLSLTTAVAIQLLTVCLLVGYLFSLDVSLAWTSISTVPVLVALAVVFRRATRAATRTAHGTRAELATLTQDTIAGIAITRAFGQEARDVAAFVESNARAIRAGLRENYLFAAVHPFSACVVGVGGAWIAWRAGLEVTHGRISLGEWYIFIQAVQLLWSPLTEVAAFWSRIQQGFGAAERVVALLDVERRVEQRGRRWPTPFTGAIRLREIDFSYVVGTPVLQSLSLEIPAGKVVALVGHTGAGKSSILRVLARLYEYQSGALLIDGCDIRSLDIARYRAALGTVPQVPHLFAGTVFDNIRYGNLRALDADVERAARSIAGGEWVRDLPAGLMTPVGTRGQRLSLGQRQLVALARALLRSPAILLLDEATASIDPINEAQIRDGLQQLTRGRTCVTVAHRLSTVQSADRIVVIQHGRVVEQGTHQELLARGAAYEQLYNKYFRD